MFCLATWAFSELTTFGRKLCKTFVWIVCIFKNIMRWIALLVKRMPCKNWVSGLTVELDMEKIKVNKKKRRKLLFWCSQKQSYICIYIADRWLTLVKRKPTFLFLSSLNQLHQLNFTKTTFLSTIITHVTFYFAYTQIHTCKFPLNHFRVHKHMFSHKTH